ncbi:MAG: hypothetical protein ACOYLT_10570 [Flavobacterium sp.]|uniref:hypothetical protein n=1 Tax=Flavobacterium sp. TaxID=239 RepID=UPI003BE289FE
MKLAKEDIVFIDTYLKNHNVIYLDIRYEMIDHIATGVEEKMQNEDLAFYDAFKDFMAANKTEILRNNKTSGTIYWDVVKQFLLFLVSPIILVFGVILFLFFNYFKLNQIFSPNFEFKEMVLMLIVFLFAFQFFYFRYYLKKRFYRVEKTGSILVLIYWLQLLFLRYHEIETISKTTLFVFSYLLFGYVAFLTKEVLKFNRHRFNYT